MLTSNASPRAASHAAKVKSTKKRWKLMVYRKEKEIINISSLNIKASKLINKIRMCMLSLEKVKTETPIPNHEILIKNTETRLLIFGFEGQWFSLFNL